MAKETLPKKISEELKEFFTRNYEISVKKNLLYELFLTSGLKLYQNSLDAPKRGYSAFQTDVCISKKKKGIFVPQVILECKSDLSSHDILVYNHKAGLHKRVYPWLRYGIIDGRLKKVPIKFFTHNENLDFFIAAGNTTPKKIADIIKAELKMSSFYERLNFEENNYSVFRNTIQVK